MCFWWCGVRLALFYVHTMRPPIVRTLKRASVTGQSRRRGKETRRRGRRQLVMSNEARRVKGPEPRRWMLYIYIYD